MRPSPQYDRWRFRVIVFSMMLLAVTAAIAILRRQFPLSLGTELCLIPCLLRELDLRRGLPARQLGSLEWSYLVGGVLWVFVAPLVR